MFMKPGLPVIGVCQILTLMCKYYQALFLFHIRIYHFPDNFIMISKMFRKCFCNWLPFWLYISLHVSSIDSFSSLTAVISHFDITMVTNILLFFLQDVFMWEYRLRESNNSRRLSCLLRSSSFLSLFGDKSVVFSFPTTLTICTGMLFLSSTKKREDY